MKLTIDTESKILRHESPEGCREIPLYSKEAFELISCQWIRVGWNEKYPYTFSWMGLPIIQLPEDMIRTQEVIHNVRPDVIIETGVARGGSLVFYASLCKALDRGRVIGVDVEIRQQNRAAIQAHPLASLITLIEGDSVADAVVSQVKDLVKPGENVLVILDSCHTKAHVRSELDAYHSLVTLGSYIVATDGVMRDLHDVPRGVPQWTRDNPTAAAQEFSQDHPEFKLEQPPWIFNESELSETITHWPGAWLKRCH